MRAVMRVVFDGRWTTSEVDRSVIMPAPGRDSIYAPFLMSRVFITVQPQATHIAEFNQYLIHLATPIKHNPNSSSL